jgi:hypothetical protein
MKPALYGMPGQEDFESGEYLIMGCQMDVDPVEFGCPDCGTQLLESGTVINPSKGIF